MHQYLVTFLPLGPDGHTTERTITAASWCPGDEWIDFRGQDGGVTHRVAHGCVLSVEVLPETATGEDIAAEALAQMPGEPYPPDERDVIYHACGASCQTGGCHTAKARTPDAGQRTGTFYVDAVPRIDPEALGAAITVAVAQAQADVIYKDNGVVSTAELRDLRFGLPTQDYGALFAPAQVFQRKPRIGDQVHYVSEDGSCLPAQVFDIGTAEINEHNPAGDGQYREALSLHHVDNCAGCTPDPGVGGVLYEPGTYTGGERMASPGEPMPLITCADLTFPPGTWHWPA